MKPSAKAKPISLHRHTRKVMPTDHASTTINKKITPNKVVTFITKTKIIFSKAKLISILGISLPTT